MPRNRLRSALVVACSLVAVPVFADNTWNVPSGDWNDPLSWLYPSVPGSMDNIQVTNGGTAEVSSAASALTLQIGQTPGSTVHVTGGQLTSGSILIDDSGALVNHGSITTDTLLINPGGTFQQSTGTLQAAGSILSSQGGTIGLTGSTRIAAQPDISSETGSMSVALAEGGSAGLSVNGGYFGTGTVDRAGQGVFSLTVNGGVFSAANGLNFYEGQSDITLNSGQMLLGGLTYAPGTSGTVSIAGGEMLLTSWTPFSLGTWDASAQVTVTQTGGKVAFSSAAGAAGGMLMLGPGCSYDLQGGQLDLLDPNTAGGWSGLFFDGANDGSRPATFTISGGTARAIYGGFYIANVSISDGALQLEGIDSSDAEIVQSGGTVTIATMPNGGMGTQGIDLRTDPAEAGLPPSHYLLSGGTLSVAGRVAAWAGSNGAPGGHFEQTGGTATVGSIQIDPSARLSVGGTASLTSGTTTVMGQFEQTGGSFSAGAFSLDSSNTPGQATASISGGELASLSMDLLPMALFTQSGGTVTTGQFNSQGLFRQTGGTLQAAGTTLSTQGGTFTLDGGFFAPAPTDQIYARAAALNLAVGGTASLTVNDGCAYVGTVRRTGQGAFSMTVNGGTLLANVTAQEGQTDITVNGGQLVSSITYSPRSSGSITVTGGELLTNGVTLGDFNGRADVAITQTGGTIAASGSGFSVFFFTVDGGSSYTLQNGSLDLSDAPYAYLFMRGSSDALTPARFSMEGGSASVHFGGFYRSIITLSGGDLHLGSLDTAAAEIQQSGGHVTIAPLPSGLGGGSLRLHDDPANGLPGTHYLLSGGDLTATGAMSVDSGHFQQTGGAASVGSLTVSPGAKHTYTGGTLSIGSNWSLQGTMDLGNAAVGVQVGPNSIANLSQGTIQYASNAWVNLTGPESLAIVAPGQPGQFASFQNEGITHTVGTLLDIPTGRTTRMTGAFHDPVHLAGSIRIVNRLTVHNTVDLDDGSTIGGDLTLGSGGVLQGNGTVGGALTNSGLLSPGHSPGTISILGNYTQTSDGVLLMEVAGLGAGQYDQLFVGGVASLDGTLLVDFADGFAPEYGQSLQLITYSSLTGQFASVESPDLPSGMHLAMDYGSGHVTATVIPEPTMLALPVVAAGLLLRRQRNPAPAQA